MDTRYESSIDGFVRMPAKDQLDIDLSPSYVVTGNHPAVIRESLLPQVFEMADKLVESAKKLVAPGLNGPFCMQTLVNDNLEVICFEISARTDGGTNTFMGGSPYSYLTYGKPMRIGKNNNLKLFFSFFIFTCFCLFFLCSNCSLPISVSVCSNKTN